MTRPGFQWYNGIELFLAFDCALVVIFNMTIFVKKKVYQSWSTAAILLAFSLLLLSRCACLLFYAMCQNELNAYTFLEISSIATDLPAYLFMNITLALIWQWWRIAKMLTMPEEEIAAIKSRKPQRRLIQAQIMLSAIAIIDACFLTAHYSSLQFWVDEGKLEDGGNVKNDPRWITIRTIFRCLMLSVSTLLLAMSCKVFSMVRKAISSNLGYEPLRKQVNIFMSVWLL